MSIPKVLAIHDMSCVGKAALTVILPILAACGVEAVPLPTAILSNHLAFPHVEKFDFTSYMHAFMNVWSQNQTTFHAIYSGYLASPKQIQIVEDAISRYKIKKSIIMIDPVMGDKGKLYKGYEHDMVLGMKHLISYADIIKPNYTEACFSCDIPEESTKIPTENTTNILFENLRKKVHNLIITSIPTSNQMFRNIFWDGDKGEKGEVSFPLIPVKTYGTGDIFSSIIIAASLKQIPLSKAVAIATDFLNEVIKFTWEEKSNPLEGICFEQELSKLIQSMKQEDI